MLVPYRKIGIGAWFIIVLFFSFPLLTYASKYDIRYDAPHDTNITAKDFNDYISKNVVTTEQRNNTKSILRGKGQTILDVAKKYDLNPHLLLAQIVFESGWGASTYAVKYNNLGGVQCMKGYKCSGNDGTGRSVTIFDSAEDSIEGIGKLLRKEYIDAGYDNLIKISERYVNGTPLNKVTTGVEHYMKNILRIAEGSGGKFTAGEKGKGKESSKDTNSSDEDEGSKGSTKGSESSREDFDPFDNTVKRVGQTGVSTRFEIFPDSMQYFLVKAINSLAKFLVYLSYVFGAIMLVFFSLQVSVLAYRIRFGGSNSYHVQRFIDLLTGKITSENLMKRLYINIGIIIFIFTFVYGRFYIHIFKLVYLLLNDLFNLF